MRTGHLLLVTLWISGAAWADTPPPSPPVPQTLEEALAQRERAAAMSDEAERRYEFEQNECYGKFLVSDCLVAAKKRRTASLIEARKLDQPARDFEREARRHEVEAEDAQRAADRVRREAEEAESAKLYRAEQVAKTAERERKRADKARKAEQGRANAAAEQAKRQAKLERRARKDAERAAEKAAREGRKETPVPVN